MDNKGLCLPLCPQLISFSVVLTLFQSPGHLLSFRDAISLSSEHLLSFSLSGVRLPTTQTYPELLTGGSSLPTTLYLSYILVALLHGIVTFSNHHVHLVPFLEGELCNHNFDLLMVVSSAYNTVGPQSSLEK